MKQYAEDVWFTFSTLAVNAHRGCRQRYQVHRPFSAFASFNLFAIPSKCPKSSPCSSRPSCRLRGSRQCRIVSVRSWPRRIGWRADCSCTNQTTARDRHCRHCRSPYCSYHRRTSACTRSRRCPCIPSCIPRCLSAVWALSEGPDCADPAPLRPSRSLWPADRKRMVRGKPVASFHESGIDVPLEALLILRATRALNNLRKRVRRIAM